MQPTSNHNEAEITLGMLTAVHSNSSVTQRSLAGGLGIALGLANAYLKRCIKKGYIKVRQIPRNRYAYYLTPVGFAEKSRLTAEYLAQGFNFYRVARNQCEQIFKDCLNSGSRRIVLWGVGDLAEVAVLCAAKVGLEVVAIVDSATDADTFLGIPVVRTLGAAAAFDAIIVTDAAAPQATYDAARAAAPGMEIFAPQILNITAEGTPPLEEAAE